MMRAWSGGAGDSHVEICTPEDEGLATFPALHVYVFPLFLMFVFHYGMAYLCLSVVGGTFQ